MIYNVKDKLPINKFILTSIQLVLSVFVATILIASLCGVNTSGALIGAGVSTLVYILCTNFKSPMYISNSGAFVTPVIMALSIGGYSAVAFGGAITCIIYCIFGFIFNFIPVKHIYKIFPKVLIGSITIVIGINLMTFIPTYVGETGNIGVIIALITMLIVALSSHYLKGALSMFPFLIGTLIGYAISIPFGLVDFSVFSGKIFSLPTLAFTQWEPIKLINLLPLALIYIAYTVSAMMECLSDHAALGGIIGIDLYTKPGLSRIFIGEGIANISGTFLGGLGQCSYGEGVACVGFSKCASIYTTIGASLIMILLGFIAPVQEFIASIPSCVFAGCAIILYGFIANSGTKQLQKVDFNNQKNLIICSSVLSIGISGIALGNSTISLSGTALALVVGVILNIILKEEERKVGKDF